MPYKSRAHQRTYQRQWIARKRQQARAQSLAGWVTQLHAFRTAYQALQHALPPLAQALQQRGTDNRYLRAEVTAYLYHLRVSLDALARPLEQLEQSAARLAALLPEAAQARAFHDGSQDRPA